ncbi:PREDICTED: jerky protein homolog-like [Trachymyrmex cornetzi]|uniref:jerky protein homolog-like n=1 Tax=Trachymyrmex cornetzi TaxID=471704 RepID=UPI00084F2250|nr:PREDICTED: jerky protein homolog-like [Trachymyrmex cornetzi]
MAPKRKKVCIPLETKLRALKRIDRGECHKKVAAKFGVGRVTVGDWIRNRAKLMAWKEKTKSSNERKAMKFTEHTKVEEALFLWFVQQREKGAPISGSILQAKALSLYSHFPDEAEKEECFAASNGWLDRWKKRYGIRLMQFNTRGEKFFEDDDVVNVFKEKFKKTIKRGGYSLEQIYNCDEISLNYKMLPNKILAWHEESLVPSNNRSKEKITILACSNASGNHKLRLTVIGKYANPRALKNLTTSTMPVYYKNQKNIWMDTTIFKWWFHKQFVPKVEKHLKKMKLPRKAILFIDNAPAHPNAAMLYDGDIIVKFFPTNVQASLIQPMEQGVFEHLKRLYRFNLLTFLLEASESGQKLTDSLEKVNLKKVVFWIAQSWKEIKPEIMKKSWNKLFNFSEKEKDLENIDLPKQKEELRNKLFEMAKSLLGPERVMETNIEEWITGDDRELDYTDAEIVALVEQKSSEESSSESDEEVVEPIERKISHSDAVSALKIVLAYVEQEEATSSDVCTLKKWRDIAAKNRSAALRETKRSKP